MDIDGVVERKGNFLVLETKNPNEKMPDGQIYTLQAFARRGDSVLVANHTVPELITGFEIWRNGSVDRSEGDMYEMARRVRQWFEWANTARWRW